MKDLGELINRNVELLLGRKSVAMEINDPDLSHQTIVITGAAGSIGSMLARHWADLDQRMTLILVDQAESPLFMLMNELVVRKHSVIVKPVVMNLQDSAAVSQLMTAYRPTGIVHTAAWKHVSLLESQPMAAIQNNIQVTYSLAELADQLGVAWFVHVSTDKAVNPNNVMGKSKRVAEKVIEAVNTSSKTRFYSIRLGNVLGSQGSLIPVLDWHIDRQIPFGLTSTSAYRYFCLPMEVSKWIGSLVEMPANEWNWLGQYGPAIHIAGLIQQWKNIRGFPDFKVKVIGLMQGEKLNEELIYLEEWIEASNVIGLHKIQTNASSNEVSLLSKISEQSWYGKTDAALHEWLDVLIGS